MANEIKVGDAVAPSSIPSDALVREEKAGKPTLHTLRRGDCYRVVGGDFGWREFAPMRPWTEVLNLPEWCMPRIVTIIALNVPADATADDLRTLAERFEVREAWQALVLETPTWPHDFQADNEAIQMWRADPSSEADAFLERLHTLGWRPGMTAQDAAGLLSGDLNPATDEHDEAKVAAFEARNRLSKVEWRIHDFHEAPGMWHNFEVSDGVDTVPTHDKRPRVCFVPWCGDSPLGNGANDPPCYSAHSVCEAFVATFGTLFGDPRILEGRERTFGDQWCPYVVYALPHPEHTK